MTEALKEAFEAASRLPDREQEHRADRTKALEAR